jgi:hypothetical protein
MSATSSSVAASSGAALPHLDIDPFSIASFDDLHPAQEALREAGRLVFSPGRPSHSPDVPVRGEEAGGVEISV